MLETEDDSPEQRQRFQNWVEDQEAARRLEIIEKPHTPSTTHPPYWDFVEVRRLK
jgi:hypothetical protein